jgi:hypothetical protein
MVLARRWKVRTKKTLSAPTLARHPSLQDQADGAFSAAASRRSSWP